ncbi:SAM-dependent methyltransferase [Virgibacillus indicus]|uniref:SAM-dependent methyltransferase n=1 Tax=Virgibacillus indicus TaxID=2024554 RepID=A0A265NC15_9BACI|nr:SAM-dependent methyltransferase [Virgibacillus indicus]
MDNLQEYDDPVSYDQENDPYTEDIFFLAKWAEMVKGTIIDLACGTGRASIPLAKQGHNLIGVDLHKGMLEQAKRKSENLQIDWFEQDCSRLDLPVKSPFIFMTGNSFQHFLTNEAQDQLLTSVNKHLDNDGVFIFNTRFPAEEEILQSAVEEYWKSYKEDGQNVDVYTVEEYDALNQIQGCTTIRRYEDGNERKTNIRLRYVFPQEMERLINANGFQILHLFGNWKEAPISNDSKEMICVCKKTVK